MAATATLGTGRSTDSPSPASCRPRCMARDVIHQLLVTDVALDKLGARSISADEAAQVPRNPHVTIANPRARGGKGKRRLLIGRSNGGRVLTLVIERTADPTTWLIVTGWGSTDSERKLLEATP